ncbi:MAG: DNA (cytosine-5-)-methyltransferase [Defluviitaleaceae bacterium]|nr:DNA (cytosine-5-)-methyltransferase [Defluviitaleaceae bacterium]
MLNKPKTFFDFCSGIGGGRLGLELNNLSCVGHSELDLETAKVYSSIHNDKRNFGDLTKINSKSLPTFDILIAGFPCQTFSIVGKRTGFEDNRGLIINYLINILVEKDVPYFIFENVKGLVNHDKGNTLKSILSQLTEAGYYVHYKVLDSQNYGVPQMRERIYIVGSKKNIDFKFPPSILQNKSLENFLIGEDNKELPTDNLTFTKYLNNKYNKDKHDLSKLLKEDYLILDTRQSDLRIYKDKCPTLRTGRHGILYVKNGKLKKLSSIEALLLQGFSLQTANLAKFSGVSESKLLGIAGNAMTVNVIQAISEKLLISINEKLSDIPIERNEQHLCLNQMIS